MVDRTVVCTGEKLIVRWMRLNNGFPAQEYHLHTASTKDQGRFLALAQRLADTGELLNYTHAHFLSAPYDQLFEFKPPNSRYLGVFVGNSVYIVHAAPKRKAKAQNADYQTAEVRRRDLIEGIKRKTGERKK